MSDGKTIPTSFNKPRPPRKPRTGAIHITLTATERQKLDWLIEQRGERATLAGVIRDLIMSARG